MERDPVKRAGAGWKPVGARKGLGCKSSSFRMDQPDDLDDDDDPFIPRHTPDQFRAPQPLKCPPYEPDPSKSCPHLHCVACKFKLIRGIEDAELKTCYSCFQCDAVYVAQG